jgi:hypothetical protein
MAIRRVIGILGAVVLSGSICESVVRADLPPEPGQTRVDYTFRASGTETGVVLIAFPMYNSAGGHVLPLDLDKDARPVQGYTPGIYSLSADDAASLKGNEDDESIASTLKAKAHLCVKKVPRLFTVPTPTNITSVADVFHIDATTTACVASFQKTLYAGANGEKGEGTIDKAGHRLPPAPFGHDLPVVGDLGFVLGPTTAPSSTAAPSTDSTTPIDNTSPPRAGCASCVVSPSDARGGEVFWIAALALGGLARLPKR